MKIGYTIVMADYGDISRQPDYSNIRDTTLQAEAAGFDSIWLYDHLLYRFVPEMPTIGIWECWSVLSALAEATDRVEIGTLVLCNSFRNPAILAKMAITVDEISNGRLIFGIGAGWNQPEYDAFGIPFNYKVDRLEESLQIIRPLFKEGRVDFTGKYYQATDCEIAPPGPRPEGPPLMIGCMGPRMMGLTARYGDMWNTAYMGTPDTFVEPMQNFRRICEQEERDPDTIELTATVAVHYPDLGQPAPLMESPLIGSVNEIADAFARYEEMGVSHLMIHATPYNQAAFDRVASSLEIVRKQ
jgi:alkanesulfonate monooxygenase SsuD/methylene tetrahydromethanopterin reductase-like flavin-dependent oxidoreductase (luciferase family)